MPGKLKAKIVAGRHLPVMDRASDLTDAFVEVRDDAFTTTILCFSIRKNTIIMYVETYMSIRKYIQV